MTIDAQRPSYARTSRRLTSYFIAPSLMVNSAMFRRSFSTQARIRVIPGSIPRYRIASRPRKSPKRTYSTHSTFGGPSGPASSQNRTLNAGRDVTRVSVHSSAVTRSSRHCGESGRLDQRFHTNPPMAKIKPATTAVATPSKNSMGSPSISARGPESRSASDLIVGAAPGAHSPAAPGASPEAAS